MVRRKPAGQRQGREGEKIYRKTKPRPSVATPNPVRRRLAECLLVLENFQRAATLRHTKQEPYLPWRPWRLCESLFLSRRHNAATPTEGVRGSRQVVSRVWTTGAADRRVHRGADSTVARAALHAAGIACPLYGVHHRIETRVHQVA